VAAVSIPISIWRGGRSGWLLLFLVVPFFLFMGAAKLFFHRYLHMMIPILAVLTAQVLVQLYRRVCTKLSLSKHAVLIAGLVVVGGLVALPIARVLKLDALLRQEDTRTLAKRWIEENLPQSTHIQVVGEPFRNVSLWHNKTSLARQKLLTPDSSKLNWLAEAGNGKYPAPNYDLTYYPHKDEKLAYRLCLTPKAYVVFPDWHPKENRSKDFGRYLESVGTVVKHVTPVSADGAAPSNFWFGYVDQFLWQMDRLGPPITIYRIESGEKRTLVPLDGKAGSFPVSVGCD
jgi:hypothetical protein